jgi:hypothetical protein
VRPDGTDTPQCFAAGQAFAAVRPLLPLLKDAVPASQPCGTIPPPGWIGALHNPRLNRTFTAVVNDDTDQGQTLKISLLKPHDVRDLRNGKVLKRSSDNTIAVTLGPGDGTLLEVIGQD